MMHVYFVNRYAQFPTDSRYLNGVKIAMGCIGLELFMPMGNW